jgi:hypothetical protein
LLGEDRSLIGEKYGKELHLTSLCTRPPEGFPVYASNRTLTNHGLNPIRHRVIDRLSFNALKEATNSRLTRSYIQTSVGVFSASEAP